MIPFCNFHYDYSKCAAFEKYSILIDKGMFCVK